MPVDLKRTEIRLATENEVHMLEALHLACEIQASAHEERARCERMVKEAIATGRGLRWVGGRAVWNNIPDETTVNYKAMVDSLLRHLSTEERATYDREFSVTSMGKYRFEFWAGGRAW